jgi:hypothetical protein
MAGQGDRPDPLFDGRRIGRACLRVDAAQEAPAHKAADDVVETWRTATPIAGSTRIGIEDDLRDLDRHTAGD